MSDLLDTPEGWFRKHHRDIHVLEYVTSENLEKIKYRKERTIRSLAIYEQYRKDSRILEQWTRLNLPSVKMSILASSEYSPYIFGGPTLKVADFNTSTREVFEQHWAAGRPWRVRVEPYADWAKKIESARLLEIPACPNESCRWWDTPEGIILMSADHESKLLSSHDAVWRLKQLRPEFASVNDFAYPYGEYIIQPNKRILRIGYGSNKIPEWSGDGYKNDRCRLGKLRAALGLTPSDEVREVVDDF